MRRTKSNLSVSVPECPVFFLVEDVTDHSNQISIYISEKASSSHVTLYNVSDDNDETDADVDTDVDLDLEVVGHTFSD